MPKAVSSTSISSMVRGELEPMATATDIDLLVEYGIMEYKEAEQTTRNTAKRLIREYRNRERKKKV